MSSELARREMERFLNSANPEVLSISGRWGVGKTFGWHAVLNAARESKIVPMPRYAYVSAFGVKSLADLKTSVFQSTVRLDRDDISPSLESFKENLSSLDGLGALAETGGRRIAKLVQSLLSAMPWASGAADLLLPSAALLIRDQIVCIDDLERAGEGLSISDILGFVSSLREEKGCKVVLLLNEAGLGADRETFNTYLEKVVDQSVKYTPTAQESAAVALDNSKLIDRKLAERTVSLGISNIRVIRRLRRFIAHVEPTLQGFNEAVLDQAISTITLLGWSIFEPKLAPPLHYLRARSDWGFILQQEDPSPDEAAWNALLQSYGFSHLDELGVAILDGLQAGGFDHRRITREADALHQKLQDAEARAAIRAPWDMYGGSFDDNRDELVDALVTSVNRAAYAMSPGDLDNVVSTLKALGEENLDDLIDVYMQQQDEKPREFFDLRRHHALRKDVDPAIKAAFADRLSHMPLARDPAEILMRIEEQRGWNPEDIEFLASLSEDQYYDMFKVARGDDLHNMIRAALRFIKMEGANESDREVSRKALEALKRIGAENRLNDLRVRPYIPRDPEEGE